MAKRDRSVADAELSDRPADVEVAAPFGLATAFRNYERFELTLRPKDGSPIAQTRDVLRGGQVAAVLPVDLERDEVVLLRQFRLPAHLATGRGEMVEIVAGRVEPGEEPIRTAARECEEEIGVRPSALVEVLRFLPTPGLTDETIILFVGSVDAAMVPERGGTAAEQEDIRPLRVPIDAALAALARGGMHNGSMVIALQWLGLNRRRLADLLRGADGPRP